MAVTFVVVALIGFADAAFLTAEHFRGVLPPCSVVAGCEKVLTSTYATMLGIPVSIIGMLYYGLLLVLMLAYFDGGNRKALVLAGWATIGGFLGTLYFLFLQAFVIHSFCQYCLLSATTSTILCVLGVIMLRRSRNALPQSHVA